MKKTIALVIVWAAITALSSCVQQSRDVHIRFSVDMTGEANVNKVGVIGMWEPLSWNEPLEMTDRDGDGIYHLEVTCQVYYNFMEFKFVKNESVPELDGSGNRVVQTDGSDDLEYRGIFDAHRPNRIATP